MFNPPTPTQPQAQAQPQPIIMMMRLVVEEDEDKDVVNIVHPMIGCRAQSRQVEDCTIDCRSVFCDAAG